MQVQYKSQWEVTSGFQVGFFAMFFFAFIYLTILKIRQHAKLRLIIAFFILAFIFNVLKIVGGITGLVLLKSTNFNETLFIVTYIFDSISLGLVLRAISSLVQHMFKQNRQQSASRNKFAFPSQYGNTDHDSNNTELKTGDVETGYDNQYNEAVDNSLVESEDELTSKNPLNPFRLVTLLILAAVVLSAVGYSLLSNDTSMSTAQNLVRAAAVLFLIGTLALIASLVYIWSHGAESLVVAPLLIAALVVLIVRCSYSLLTAFHGIHFNEPSKYMLIFGDYKYYTFLGLLTEGIANVLMLAAFSQW